MKAPVDAGRQMNVRLVWGSESLVPRRTEARLGGESGTAKPVPMRVDTACKALYDDAPNGCPFGRLAQGLEHLPYTQGVVGSNPPPPTIFPEHLTAGS